MLTKEQIIAHPDFSKLVAFSIKRFSMKSKLKTLGITADEFIHEVMAHVWLRGGSNEKLHTMTTMVIKHCQYTIGKLLRNHLSGPKPVDNEVLNNLHADNCGPNESAFLLNKAIERTTALTAVEHGVLQLLSRGMSLRYTSRELGYSLESVQFAHERAFQKVRKANPHGIY